MHWQKPVIIAGFVIFGMIMSSLSVADLVYNEASLGDFSNFENAPTVLGVFAEGVNDVIGIVGGTANPNNGDGFDVFAFTVDTNKQLASIFVNDYQVSGGNTSTGFNLYQGTAGSGTFLGSTAIDVGDIGSDVLTLIGVGQLGAGNYYVSLREFSAPNQTYSFGFVVVPEPTAVLGLVVSSLSALMMRRRLS